jgi:hypothetical protein
LLINIVKLEILTRLFKSDLNFLPLLPLNARCGHWAMLVELFCYVSAVYALCSLALIIAKLMKTKFRLRISFFLHKNNMLCKEQ